MSTVNWRPMSGEEYCRIPAVSGHERVVFLVWD